jgi:hypothetical protein
MVGTRAGGFPMAGNRDAVERVPTRRRVRKRECVEGTPSSVADLLYQIWANLVVEEVL